MTFESTQRETQELQPIKTPTNILTRLRGSETEAEREREREGERQREMPVLDENVLTW